MMCKTLWIGHSNSLHNISFELKNILASKMHGTKEYSIILQTHSQKAWLEWKCFAYLLSKIKRLNSSYETKMFFIECICMLMIPLDKTLSLKMQHIALNLNMKLIKDVKNLERKEISKGCICITFYIMCIYNNPRKCWYYR